MTEQRIVTAAYLHAVPERVWEKLLFFEQVPGPPPFLLSLLLPSPERVEGCRSRVGDETRCVYAQGYLVKRITAAIPHRLLSFEVIEQELRIGRGIRLEGGSYQLDETQGGTRVVVETRYRARVPWRLLWQPLEALVGHAFHRHLIAALRHELQSAERPATPMSPHPMATRRP